MKKYILSFAIIIGFVFILTLSIQMTRLDMGLRAKVNIDVIDSVKLNGIKVPNELKKNLKQDSYTIVYDKSESYLRPISENIAKTLEYMKKDYEIVELDKLTTLDEIENLILVLEDLTNVNNLQDIFTFVNGGGNLFFANRLAPIDKFSSVANKVGISEYGKFVESEGIRLLDNLLIKGEGVEVSNKDIISNSSIEVQLSNECKIHAISSDGVNLLWSKEYGHGEIFYFNGTMLADKNNRGLISGVISSMGENNIYPIINAKLNFIDDFPAPIPEGYDERIYKDYGRSISEFYREIWWPNIVRISVKNKYPYTTVMIGTYNDKTENIKDNSIELKPNVLKEYGSEILDLGGEIGVHGYNHQPLVEGGVKNKDLGYKTWKDMNVMTSSINQLVDFYERYLPKYSLNVYVPPSNIIDEYGIEALKKSNMNLRIISSIYDSGSEIDTYEQEIEVGEDGIINLPRIISGYEYSEIDEWRIANSVNLNGYFSHFAHPDDILDSHRSNNKSWKELNKEYENMQNDVYERYPWLKGTTASEAANRLTIYSESQPYYEKSDDYINIYIDNYVGELEFILRTDKKIKITNGCEYELIDEGIYLIKAKENSSKIVFEG